MHQRLGSEIRRLQINKSRELLKKNETGRSKKILNRQRRKDSAPPRWATVGEKLCLRKHHPKRVGLLSKTTRAPIKKLFGRFLNCLKRHFIWTEKYLYDPCMQPHTC